MPLPGLEILSAFPYWSGLSLLFALGITGYSGWSLWRERRRPDLFYLLLGMYLLALQLPLFVPSLAATLGLTCPVDGSPTRLLRAAPAGVLLLLAATSR